MTVNADPKVGLWPAGGHEVCVLAASSRWPADAWLRSHRQSARFILTGADVLHSGRGFRSQLRSAGIDSVVVHSLSWPHQTAVPLYQLALLISPARDLFIVDEAADRTIRVTRRQLVRSLAAVTPAVVTGVAQAGIELARARRRQLVRQETSDATRAEVLAIWRGAPHAKVGGSVTHISGVLGGFRRRGMTVSLVSLVQPPVQLADAVDRVAVTLPGGPGTRLTNELERLSTNKAIRRAARRLVASTGTPKFVYQRHDLYLAAGAEVAGQLGVPLVLEWNGSEAWATDRWDRLGKPATGPRGAFHRAAVDLEQRMLTRADLVVAVSDQAATQALAGGADPDCLLVVPNGVDASVATVAPSSRHSFDTTIGWIGSFGPWHGALQVVRALSLLPESFGALMIGDGSGRAACVELAEEMRLSHRIEWTGSLAHLEAVGRLAACDVLVSPHLPQADPPFFGSPTKIFEYMAIGRPIVASGLEQIGGILTDGTTARLVEPGDVRELAQAILEVMSLPDSGQGLADAAQRAVLASHTWDRRAAVILDAVEGLKHLRRPA